MWSIQKLSLTLLFCFPSSISAQAPSTLTAIEKGQVGERESVIFWLLFTRSIISQLPTRARKKNVIGWQRRHRWHVGRKGIKRKGFESNFAHWLASREWKPKPYLFHCLKHDSFFSRCSNLFKRHENWNTICVCVLWLPSVAEGTTEEIAADAATVAAADGPADEPSPPVASSPAEAP